MYADYGAMTTEFGPRCTSSSLWLDTVVSATATGAAYVHALFAVNSPHYARAHGGRANAIAAPLVLDLADRAAARQGQAYWGWESYTPRPAFYLDPPRAERLSPRDRSGSGRGVRCGFLSVLISATGLQKQVRT